MNEVTSPTQPKICMMERKRERSKEISMVSERVAGRENVKHKESFYILTTITHTHAISHRFPIGCSVDQYNLVLVKLLYFPSKKYLFMDKYLRYRIEFFFVETIQT